MRDLQLPTQLASSNQTWGEMNIMTILLCRKVLYHRFLAEGAKNPKSIQIRLGGHMGCAGIYLAITLM